MPPLGTTWVWCGKESRSRIADKAWSAARGWRECRRYRARAKGRMPSTPLVYGGPCFFRFAAGRCRFVFFPAFGLLLPGVLRPGDFGGRETFARNSRNVVCLHFSIVSAVLNSATSSLFDFVLYFPASTLFFSRTVLPLPHKARKAWCVMFSYSRAECESGPEASVPIGRLAQPTMTPAQNLSIKPKEH